MEELDFQCYSNITQVYSKITSKMTRLKRKHEFIVGYFPYFHAFGANLAKFLLWNIWLFELHVFFQCNFHLLNLSHRFFLVPFLQTLQCYYANIMNDTPVKISKCLSAFKNGELVSTSFKSSQS